MFKSEKPKYQTLKEYLIETIKSEKLKPGDKTQTEIELAEKFGVSRHTIRQAIGELVAEGWLYRVQGKGTFVKRRHDQGTSSTDSKTIGMVTTYLNEYIFSAIIRGIDKVLSSRGYNIVLSCTYNMHEKEKACISNMLNRKIDGLIVESTRSAIPNPNLQLYKDLGAKGVPVLFIHGCYRGLECSYIVEDDMLGGYLAAKHLIELGHREIGGIFKVDDIQGHYRFEGFQKACCEYGISVNDSSVLWFDTFDLNIKFEFESGNIIKNIVKNNTGIVCYNDQIAVKLMDVIRGMGLSVPEDISIVSFDDSDLATASEPKLTTLAHPKEQLGIRAAESIIQMIKRKTSCFSEIIEPKLIIRNSTKQR